MAKDTLIFALNGEVPLHEYAQVMGDLTALLDSLTKEVVGRQKGIHWEISNLQAGSAIATIRGIAEEEKDVERVITAYEIVGDALQNNTPIPYSRDVGEHARNITHVINGYIKSVSFGTDRKQIQINTRVEEKSEIDQSRHLGVIEGVVEMISSRRNLQINVYDSLFDNAVPCYLEEKHREKARLAWGKKVAVTGYIKRNPENGKPIDIRGVVDLEVITESDSLSYKKLRGIIPWREGTRRSEEIIREFRDAD